MATPGATPVATVRPVDGASVGEADAFYRPFKIMIWIEAIKLII
jgi:hypothetical protein